MTAMSRTSAACCFLAVFLFVSSVFASETPTDFVKGLVTDTRDSIEKKIDFDFVTREAMGSHFAESSDSQRKEIRSLLRDLMMRAMCRSFDEVKSHSVKYVSESTSVDESTVTVVTLPEPQKAYDPTEIVFHMSPTSEKTLVRDVEIEGVSLIDSYRHQIHKIVVKHGVDGVIRKMRDRIQNPPAGC